MLKLKLQYFGHLMRRVDSLEKTLMLRRIGGRRRRGWQEEDEMAGWHHWLDEHEFEWTPGVGDSGRPGVLQFMGSQRIGHDWGTELNWVFYCIYIFFYPLICWWTFKLFPCVAIMNSTSMNIGWVFLFDSSFFQNWLSNIIKDSISTIKKRSTVHDMSY